MKCLTGVDSILSIVPSINQFQLRRIFGEKVAQKKQVFFPTCRFPDTSFSRCVVFPMRRFPDASFSRSVVFPKRHFPDASFSRRVVFPTHRFCAHHFRSFLLFCFQSDLFNSVNWTFCQMVLFKATHFCNPSFWLMIPFCNHLFHQSVIFARGHFEKTLILETCCLMH